MGTLRRGKLGYMIALCSGDFRLLAQFRRRRLLWSLLPVLLLLLLPCPFLRIRRMMVRLLKRGGESSEKRLTSRWIDPELTCPNLPAAAPRSLQKFEVSTTASTDFEILYRTLVADKALPNGYLREFMALELPARRASKRRLKFSSSITDSSATEALRAFHEESGRQAVEQSTIRDQLLAAADLRPRKFRAKWQREVYDGPTARKDAESAERERWIHLLGTLLQHTDTPMGKLREDSPSNIQLLGGGRRAGTLRARVRSVQKFLAWLMASHGVNFPVHWRQLNRTLRQKIIEACPLLVHLLAGGGRGRRQAY